MDKLEKSINIAIVIVLILMSIFFICFIFEAKEMINDYRCSQLPINEFFQDKECERYWRYRENER